MWRAETEHHAHAISLHFLDHNFARVHKTLRVTPAMQAGLADHVWSLEHVVGLLDRRVRRTSMTPSAYALFQTEALPTFHLWWAVSSNGTRFQRIFVVKPCLSS